MRDDTLAMSKGRVAGLSFFSVLLSGGGEFAELLCSGAWDCILRA